MGLFGLVFAQNAWRSADLASYAVLVFGSAAALVVFTTMPETQEARQRTRDVLACRPVPQRTFLAARAVSLGLAGTLVAVLFGGVALAAGAIRFGAPLLFP